MRLKDLGTVTTVIKQIGAGAKDIELVKKAIDGLTLSNKAAVLTTTNLTKSEQISLLTSRTVTKEEAKQALATAASSAANVAETATTKGLTTAKTALTSATKGLWAVMKAHPLMAIVAVAGVAISIFSKMRESAEKLSEKVGEVTSEYKEQISALVGGKNAFETEAARYAQLSKGVDALGKNVSLTADEYAEYQSIVNQIADQIPSLVSGYDSQGNAILSCKGNVDELTAAYEKLIHAQNQSILVNAGDIEKDFANKVKSASGEHFWSDNHGFWAGILNGLGGFSGASAGIFGEDYELKEDTVKRLEGLLSASNKNQRDKIYEEFSSDNFSRAELRTALERAGVEIGFFDSPTKVLEQTLKNEPEKAKGIIDNYYSQFADTVERQKTIATAKLSEAFDISSTISGLNYGNISEELRAIAYQTVNSLDYDFLTKLEENGKTVEQWTREMLDSLNSISEIDNARIESAFDLQTKFNGGDISYGEYVKNLEHVRSTVDGLELNDEAKTQLKISLRLDEGGIVDQYNSLLNRLTETSSDNISTGNAIGLDKEQAEAFINNLSAEELQVITQIIPKLDAGATIEQIQAAINREMAVRGLMFNLDLEAESSGLAAVNSALKESVSATGLSSEAIGSLKARYANLEAEGYNLAAVFEETSNGIRLNRDAVKELEKAYVEQKQTAIKEDLNALEEEYNLLTEEIEGCNDASERAALYVQRDAIIQQINDAATLASQYDGLTSAYNEWLAAEEAGQERDMYERVLSGLKSVGEELARGWADNGSIEFLELLTGRTDLATLSAKELKAVYDGLDEKINGTTYSVRDFFTVDEDGNSTSAGVHNFLKAVQQKYKDQNVIQTDDKGNIVSFDFQVVGGDKAIAEALGISEELVQIMLRAADDAGFVVRLDGSWTQLADLKSEAEKARDALISLQKEGLGELEDTDVNFNLNASGQDLVAEQEKAVNLLEKFRNADGTINTSIKGADEALEIAEYLTLKLDDLTEPRYMQIDVTTVKESLQDPIKKMQEFEKLSKQKHLLTLTGDKEGIEEINTEMSEIATKLANLPSEVEVELGLQGLTSEEIAEKLEKGQIEIPAELNIDLQMSDDLKDMRLMMMNQLGLVSDEEVKLKLGFDIDDSVVDSLTEDEKKVAVKYFEEHDEVDDYTPEEKNALVKYIADGGDVKAWHDRNDNIEIIAKVLGTEDIDSLSSKLASFDHTTIQIVADVLGRANIDDLANIFNGLEDKEISAIATAMGEGDVESLKSAIDDLDDETVLAIAQAFGYEDVTSLDAAMEKLDDKTVQALAETMGIKDVGTLKNAVDELQGKKVVVNAAVSGFNSLSNLSKTIKGITDKTVRVSVVTAGAQAVKKAIDKISGTHQLNGTANLSGTAYADGNWGTALGGETLVGELGREIVVDPHTGRWHTVGDNGAEFTDIPRDAIVFNHKQSEALLKHGHVIGRGKALASGTALVSGTQTSGNAMASGTTSSKSSENTKTEIDWIAVAIERLGHIITKLKSTASSAFDALKTKLSTTTDLITKTTKEIDLQWKAYSKYVEKANAVGLSNDLRKKVQSGEINISEYDEATAKRIEEYQKWFELALKADEEIVELYEEIASLYADKFEYIEKDFDNQISLLEHWSNAYNNSMDELEARGYLASSQYYNTLQSIEKEKVTLLEQELKDLTKAYSEAMSSGLIEKYSEEWYAFQDSINGVKEKLQEANIAMLEFVKSAREVEWEHFDYLQERISLLNDEADFYIDLLSNSKLFEDSGKLTDEGMATVGLHGQNYNVYMAQADMYAEEMRKIQKELEADPYNTDLIARRDELLKLQRESILAAEDEKQAIAELIREGYEKELDSLQSLIDKYVEALEQTRDLYDYQKKIADHTSEISTLQKQITAYEGDGSEETRAKLQQLRVDLEKAETDLEETQYDKYISDQKKLLDSLYTEYEELINQRLDNIDVLISDMIANINLNSELINDTLKQTGDSVGYTMTNEMQSIWSNATGSINGVLSEYGDNFIQTMTTISQTINSIKSYVAKMVGASDKEAQDDSVITGQEDIPLNGPGGKNPAFSSGSGNSGGSSHSSGSSSSSSGAIAVNGKINASGAKIYSYAGDTSGSNQVYANDPIYTVLKVNGNWIQVRHHKLSSGISGWFKKSDVKAYKTGGLVDETGLAWLDGTKGKPEMVLNADDTENFLELNSYIRRLSNQGLSLRSGNIGYVAHGMSIAHGNNIDISKILSHVRENDFSNGNERAISNTFGDTIISIDHVEDYQDFVSQLQKDKNFEKMIQSMTVDRLVGKSSLAKNKFNFKR